jgi:selenide,water dikinase
MPEIDLAKRRRIMQRSQKLGHCVCDPRRPCPCDVFTDQGVCPCAGERPDPTPIEQVRLTEHVRNAGCASKIAPAELERFLARLPQPSDPNVLSGTAAGDDAGLYRLSDGTVLVQTVDVFTPCCDDPETFGRICAANCLSDIYAMGAEPKTALSVLGFPSETLDGRIMYHMLKGAAEVFDRAGVSLIGGHSVKDEEIKLGFAITGLADDGAAVEKGGARLGDALVLTKPLGVGVLNFARQIGRAEPGAIAEAEASMAELNAGAAQAMRAAGASACTDVTGFGLFGHLIGMCRAAGLTAQIWADHLPALPGAIDLLAQGVVPGAIERNREFVGEDIGVAEGVDEARAHLGFDAQTSGGLLIAVAPDRLESLLEQLARRDSRAWTIGWMAEESSGRIALTASGQTPGAAGLGEAAEAVNRRPAEPTGRGQSCCAGAGDKADGAPGAALKGFGQLMRATAGGGAVDARTKELVNLALVILSRCGPCLKTHLAKARSMGISQAEIDEVAWCAVAMGGAPVKMFYEHAQEAPDAEPGAGGRCC